jgi:hypothetical protein
MHSSKHTLVVCLTALLAIPPQAPAANHREAPITALDHKADITDVYAFRSYGGDATPKVTLILCVDGLQEPANGPNWWPFDSEILYQLKVDNNNDAVEDVVFQFRFTTEQRLGDLFQVYAGVNGVPGLPPKINSFASAGLGQRQSYTVTMIKNGVTTQLTGSTPFYAVPSNVGPRTIDYDALYAAGTYSLANEVKVFAGTTDDAFWIDLGAAFDTLNLRSTVAPGALSASQDAATSNSAPDTVSGYSVNTIAIEVPVAMLTRTGQVESANSTAATIGVWGATSRPRTTVRRAPLAQLSSGSFSQVQRMGNPLINELLIGTGMKDRFSMDEPKNDSQFADFFLNPRITAVANALVGLGTPATNRTDLLPVVTYAPPIAAAGTPSGPVADLLRLNTGVAPRALASQSRLGVLGADPAGFPNGRRPADDVTDIALRLVVGGVLISPPFASFNANVHGRLGDGVNVNDMPYPTAFPYMPKAPSGRDRRHVDPGEPGCLGAPGGVCPVQ